MAAWLTPSEPAALAVLRVTSPPSLDGSVPGPGRVAFRRLLGRDGAPIDEVVVLGGAGWWDICCHGGAGVRAAVTAALRVAEVPPMGDRWARLAAAAHPAAVAWLLAHGDAPPPFPAAFLTRAPTVLLAGPANAGKSTLLNAWCGRPRAVVDAVPGTTRDLVSAEALSGGWRLRLIDSAGERDTDDSIERAGQELARTARSRVDLVLWLDVPGGAPAPTAALRIAARADEHDPVGRGVPWSARAASAERLAVLGRAVLARLGLPDHSGPNIPS